MKYVLVVCLLAMAALNISLGQVKTKGVNVKLPSATNARALPAADRPDALVVAIGQDGVIYFGVEQVPLADLPEKAQETISKRRDKTVYVKSDARGSSSELVAVLDAFAGARASVVVLLTNPREPAQSGTVVRPTGLQLKFVDRSED